MHTSLNACASLQNRARSCTVAKQNADNWTCRHCPTTVKDDKFSNATMVLRTSLLSSMVEFFLTFCCKTLVDIALGWLSFSFIPSTRSFTSWQDAQHCSWLLISCSSSTCTGSLSAKQALQSICYSGISTSTSNSQRIICIFSIIVPSSSTFAFGGLRLAASCLAASYLNLKFPKKMDVYFEKSFLSQKNDKKFMNVSQCSYGCIVVADPVLQLVCN